LRHSNSLEAAWVDAVDAHDKDGSCKLATWNSLILHADGCFGPCDSILSVGMEQSMSFLSTDVGPFWMTAKEQNERSLDRARRDAVS
jgi:hypothetical protein